MKIRWKKEPEEHDYPAALSYLSLIMFPADAEEIVHRLKTSPMTHFKAKDIFRASGLSLLGVSNGHVKKNQKAMKRGEKMSPILLVRGDNKVIVADGYHRLCAVYGYDEDAEIPVKIW